MAMKTEESGNHKWTRDETFLLIDLIQRIRCLWDPSDPSRLKKSAAHDAHIKISSDMEIDVKSIKKKICGLRAQMSGEYFIKS